MHLGNAWEGTPVLVSLALNIPAHSSLLGRLIQTAAIGIVQRLEQSIKWFSIVNQNTVPWNLPSNIGRCRKQGPHPYRASNHGECPSIMDPAWVQEGLNDSQHMIVAPCCSRIVSGIRLMLLLLQHEDLGSGESRFMHLLPPHHLRPTPLYSLSLSLSPTHTPHVLPSLWPNHVDPWPVNSLETLACGHLASAV